MIGEKCLQRIRLVGNHADDMGDEGFVEIEKLSARDRMLTNQRPDTLTEPGNALVEPLLGRLIALRLRETVPEIAVIVHGVERLEIGFHAFGQAWALCERHTCY